MTINFMYMRWIQTTHMSQDLLTPEAVLTGFAFNFGKSTCKLCRIEAFLLKYVCSTFLYSWGTAAMISTNLGWLETPYLLAT